MRGCFGIGIFFPQPSAGYILLWHNGFILADIHGERCTNELQVQGEMHPLRSEHHCSSQQHTSRQLSHESYLYLSLHTNMFTNKPGTKADSMCTPATWWQILGLRKPTRHIQKRILRREFSLTHGISAQKPVSYSLSTNKPV